MWKASGQGSLAGKVAVVKSSVAGSVIRARDPFVSQSPSLAGLSTMAIIFDIGT